MNLIGEKNMTRTELNKLHQKHLEYLMDNSPTDYIIEDRGIDTFKSHSRF